MNLRSAAFVAALLVVSGCTTGRGPVGTSSALLRQAALPSVPVPGATGVQSALVRGTVALARRGDSRQQSVTYLVNETFANAITPPNAWFYSAGTCLTAGSTPPPSSIPACGTTAQQDPPGAGALQLTQSIYYVDAIVGWNAPLPTAHGLTVTFTSFSFDGGTGDGTLMFFTDGSQAPPSQPADNGGCLAYLGNITYDCPPAGLANAYLGVGFDEFGDFSLFLRANGKQPVPQTVALAGALSAGFPYLGGVHNAEGVPVSLPFKLNDPGATMRPATAPTMRVSLTPAGLVEVAIDIHDGRGFLTYVAKNIVGIGGQPAVPASVYVGFAGSNGQDYSRRQIDDVTISTYPLVRK